jgi:hypothetical protein
MPGCRLRFSSRRVSGSVGSNSAIKSFSRSRTYCARCMHPPCALDEIRLGEWLHRCGVPTRDVPVELKLRWLERQTVQDLRHSAASCETIQRRTGGRRSPDRASRRKVTSPRRTCASPAVASSAMNETIRAYLKRRVRWISAVGLLGWLVFPLTAIVLPREPGHNIGGTLPAFGGLLFAGAIIALNWAIKCPRCCANLGRTIAMPLGLSWGSGPRINFCPYCGVGLDEPRVKQTSASPPAPFNPIS